MNHLAHLLTAGHCGDPQIDELRLGVLLGDHVRGRRAVKAFAPDVASGIMLHRAVDQFTDHDPALAELRNDFQPPHRRYVGIMLDVYFDHLLSRQWSDYCNQPLASFTAAVMELLTAHQRLLPASLERFRRYAQRTNVLQRYGEIDMLREVYAGIGQRLSFANPLHEALDVLLPKQANIQSAFDEFMPRLLNYARQWRELHGFT